MTNINHERSIDSIEIMDRLAHSHVKPLILALQDEPRCLTSKGRLNLSATARHLGVPCSQVSKMVMLAREQHYRLYGT